MVQVRCRESLATYGGEFLVAADTFGEGRVLRGVSTGSALAVAAVGLPLFAVVLAPVMVVQTLRRRRMRRGDVIR